MRRRPFRLRQGGNTLVVECRSAADSAVTPADALLQFQDAKDGQPLSDLIFDVAAKP